MESSLSGQIGKQHTNMKTHMTNTEIAIKTDHQFLMLMKSVHEFLNGHITIKKLQEAQEKAEIYRSFAPVISEKETH